MIQQLLAHLEQQHFDAMFIQKKENVRYISGYTGDDSYLFITKKQAYFITDPRYTEQAAEECPAFTLHNWRSGNQTVVDAVAALAAQEKAKNIAFESDGMSAGAYLALQKATTAELIPTAGIIEQMRTIKTPEEIANLRIACEIACRALDRLLPEIRVGVTEKELAARLAHYMVLEGADTQPYGNILISGKRTSLLHGIPSSKAVEYGDFVLMDFGCQYKGYLSDMTRTVVVGKASDRQREVYQLEKQMIENAESVMKAGASVEEVYDASVRGMQQSEYLPYHYPSIGHGIGLFVHEMPFIRPHSDAVLQEGNVCTIEPGIYIPGWGGVRIEDQVVITQDGYENLVRTTHDLIEL